jgi:hypothetical protein
MILCVIAIQERRNTWGAIRTIGRPGLLAAICSTEATTMRPAAYLLALLCPLVVWPFAVPLDVSTIDLLKLFPFGTTQFGLGLVFLTVGGQLVSATENTLETWFGVAWVWACFSEAPSIGNFAGGMIVMASVVGHVWHSNRMRLATAAV